MAGWALVEVADSVARLASQMEQAVAAQGLTRRELMATQRGIRQLARRGTAPSPNQFWETTAMPRAERLTGLARAVIDEELTRLAGTLQAGVRERGRLGPGAAAPMGNDVLNVELVGAMAGPDRIDDLGAWWQRRLRRAALVPALPDLLAGTPAEADLIVTNHAMGLLDTPPWAHGDRLLSAFELARTDIKAHGRRWLQRLTLPA